MVGLRVARVGAVQHDLRRPVRRPAGRPALPGLVRHGGDLVSWSNFWAYLLLGLGIMLLIRGFLDLLLRHYHGYGKIIGGMVVAVIGSAGITVSLGGWGQYLWIAIIVVGGLLIILVGLLTYLFKR